MNRASRPRGLAALALALALAPATLLAGCSRPATQLVAVVSSDFVDADPLGSVTVTVETPAGEMRSQQRFELASGGVLDAGAGRFVLPLSLGVAPEGRDAQRRVRVIARGYGRDGAWRVERSALTGFVAGASLTLPLFLPRACADVRCPRGTTCVAGPPVACVPDFVDPRLLLPASRDGGELGADAALPFDGTPTPPLDGAVDAEPVEGDGGAILPPRPISPLSGSVLNTTTTVLQWALAPGTRGAVLEICADRACATLLRPPERLAGATGWVVPDGALARHRVVFWRLRGLRSTDGAVGPTTSPVWEFWTGTMAAARSLVLSQVLDVNGDGYADLAVGAPGASPSGLPGAGQVRVFLGGPMGLGSTVATTINGQVAGDRLGTSLAAGDMNGDGFVDLLVGVPRAPVSGPDVVQLYVGSPGGLAASPVQTFTDGMGDSELGHAVASGDVNGDGYADLIAGAPNTNAGRGAVQVFPGPNTLVTPAIVTLSLPGGPGDRLGTTVAVVGDMTGDGLADVVAGAPATSHVRAYYGDRMNLLSNRAPLLDRANGAAGEDFGASVAGAGDVNNDGFNDVIVGVPGASSGGLTANGEARVFYGDMFTGLPTTGTAYAGMLSSERLGVAVATAGDVDRDGHSDLVVGVPNGMSAGVTGVARVVRGRTAATWGLHATLVARGSGEFFGGALACVGDTDGDGYPEIAVGAERAASPMLPDVGGVRVFRTTNGTDYTVALDLFGLASTDRFGHALAPR